MTGHNWAALAARAVFVIGLAILATDPIRHAVEQIITSQP